MRRSRRRNAPLPRSRRHRSDARRHRQSGAAQTDRRGMRLPRSADLSSGHPGSGRRGHPPRPRPDRQCLGRRGAMSAAPIRFWPFRSPRRLWDPCSPRSSPVRSSTARPARNRATDAGSSLGARPSCVSAAPVSAAPARRAPADRRPARAPGESERRGPAIRAGSVRPVFRSHPPRA